jgi:hypothetical protein
MYAQCDEGGNQYNLMESIVDHKTDGHAIDWDDMYINQRSNKQVRRTTKGWHLCNERKDGTTSFELLADLKKVTLLKLLVAEYAVSKNLFDGPAFVYWVPYMTGIYKR